MTVIDGKKFVNLTPHQIVIQSPGGQVVTIESDAPKKGAKARVYPNYKENFMIGGIQISDHDGYVAIGVPRPRPNTFYIVSNRIASAITDDRKDLLTPDTDDVIRYPNGKIEAIRQLLRHIGR